MCVVHSDSGKTKQSASRMEAIFLIDAKVLGFVALLWQVGCHHYTDERHQRSSISAARQIIEPR
jgi:hypothetical protein